MDLKHLFGIFFSAALLSACASTPTVNDLERESGDLSVVANDVMLVTRQVGEDAVLVVFDLDNTLLAMEQGLGSDQWYYWQKAQARKDACDKRVVNDRFAVQGAMFFASAMRPTQPDAAQLVKELQDQDLRVIALTSRGVVYRLQTFRELRRNGYDFRRSAIGPEAGWPEDFVPDSGSRPARYEDGVFLTSGQHKGKMLEELLRRTDTPLPGVVFMVDDKQENLDAVKETFSALGVAVRAWRYSGEDDEVAAFDGDESHATWLQLKPALETLQRVLGPDNYELHEDATRSGCE